MIQCDIHGTSPSSTPVEGKRGSVPRCLRCVASAIEKSPKAFIVTTAFYARLRPYLDGFPIGLRVLP